MATILRTAMERLILQAIDTPTTALWLCICLFHILLFYRTRPSSNTFRPATVHVAGAITCPADRGSCNAEYGTCVCPGWSGVYCTEQSTKSKTDAGLKCLEWCKLGTFLLPPATDQHFCTSSGLLQLPLPTALFNFITRTHTHYRYVGNGQHDRGY